MTSTRRGLWPVAIVGAALALFGLLWTTCSLVSGLSFPVSGYGVANLVAGLALIVTGGALLARSRVMRSPRRRTLRP